MFPELKNYLNDLESTAESTGSFLRKLNGGRRRNINAIEKSETEVKLLKDERKYVASLKPQIQKDAIELSKTILFNNATTALRTNKEFDDPVYRAPLFGAIESNDTYLARIYGTGFASKISVDINLDKSAGRLNMWGAAIKAVRANLGIKVPRRGSRNYESSALKASRAWAGMYSRKDEKYYSTVSARLDASAKIAPFWSIINFGTPPGMASDRGGYPTPKNSGTNFVHKAEEEIKSAIAGLFDTAKENHKVIFSDYNKFLEEAKARQIRLDKMADEIRLDRATARRLEREYGLEKSEIDRNKLEKAVNDVRKNLTTRSVFEIGSKGKRKRISRGTIERFYL